MLLKFKYNRDLIELLKEGLPKHSRRWNGNARGWEVTDSYIYDAVRIIAPFEPALAKAMLTDDLYKVARDTADAVTAKVEASQATDSDIDIPVPEGLAYRPFQRAGIAYAVKQRGTLIADEMGLGKTIQALGVCNVLRPERVLVVCPASLKLNWAEEAAKWLVDTDYDIKVLYSKTDIPTGKVFAIINFDIFKRCEAKLQEEWDLVIVDECHYLKNYRVDKNGKAKGSQRAVSTFSVTAKAKRLVYLTGTPIGNRPKELFPLVNSLRPDKFGSWFGFAKRFCGAVHNGFGWDFSGASNLEELQIKLRSTCMVRRLKSEVLKELPPKVRQMIILDSADFDKSLEEEELVNDAFEYLLRGKLTTLKEGTEGLTPAEWLPFEEIARIRHKSAMAKVPAVIRFVDSLLEEKDKVVVFAHHKDVVKKIMNTYGASAVKVVGGMTDIEKNQAVDSFQNDPTIRVFVGNIQSAGVGITLTASDTVVFAELDWVPGNISQAEDRCHRIGQLGCVNIFHVVVDGSIDARLAKTIMAKQEVIDKALNNVVIKEIPKVAEIKDLPVVKKRTVAPVSKQHKFVTHLRLKYLASVCDGASSEDGMGFNKFDVKIGFSLAYAEVLSDKQVMLADKILYKYRGQLAGEDFIAYREDETIDGAKLQKGA